MLLLPSLRPFSSSSYMAVERFTHREESKYMSEKKKKEASSFLRDFSTSSVLDKKNFKV